MSDDLPGRLRCCAAISPDGEMTRLRPEARKLMDTAADEIERLRALIAELDRGTMWESVGFGNTFADSIERLVMYGGRCPTVREAYGYDPAPEREG